MDAHSSLSDRERTYRYADGAPYDHVRLPSIRTAADAAPHRQASRLIPPSIDSDALPRHAIARDRDHIGDYPRTSLDSRPTLELGPERFRPFQPPTEPDSDRPPRFPSGRPYHRAEVQVKAQEHLGQEDWSHDEAPAPYSRYSGFTYSDDDLARRDPPHLVRHTEGGQGPSMPSTRHHGVSRDGPRDWDNNSRIANVSSGSWTTSMDDSWSRRDKRPRVNTGGSFATFTAPQPEVYRSDIQGISDPRAPAGAYSNDSFAHYRERPDALTHEVRDRHPSQYASQHRPGHHRHHPSLETAPPLRMGFDDAPETGRGAGAPTRMDDASSKTKRRKRAILSCTECKQRKIKCDRNVPNCGSCVRRGVAHLCRWGDERDHMTAGPMSSITPSNAALMARIAQLEAQVRALQSNEGTKQSSPMDVESGPSRRPLSDVDDNEAGGFANLRDAREAVGRRASGSLSAEDEDAHHRLRAPRQGDSTATERWRNSYLSIGSATSFSKASSLDQPLHDRGSEGVTESESEDDSKLGPPRKKELSPFNAPKANQAKQSAGADSNQGDDVVDVLEELFDGLVLFPSKTQEEAVRTDTQMSKMAYMLKLLPPRENVRRIINIYLAEAEHLLNAINQPVFWRDFDQFWARIDASGADLSALMQAAQDWDSVAEILQFGSLIFALVVSACEFMSASEMIESGICSSVAEISSRLTLLVRCGMSCIVMSGFPRRPKLSGLQTFTLLRHYSFSENHLDEFLVLYVTVMQSSQSIGLAQLGSALDDSERWSAPEPELDEAKEQSRRDLLASTRISLDDLSDMVEDMSESENAKLLTMRSSRQRGKAISTRPFGDRSHVFREYGRKVWLSAVTIEWQFFDPWYPSVNTGFSTRPPVNIDDEDLLALGEAGLGTSESRKHELLSRIKGKDDATSNSFIRVYLEFCDLLWSISDGMKDGFESYATVLEIDERLRRLLGSLPRFYRLDGRSEYEAEVVEMHRSRPYLSLQRAAIHEYVHHQLVKLHRSYMGRGYWKAEYEPSTRTCVESARAVIAVNKSLFRVKSYGQKFWVLKLHVLHAVVALQVDLLLLAGEAMDSDTGAKREEVAAGLDMLQARSSPVATNEVLSRGMKVIKVLQQLEHKVRASHAPESASNTHASRNTDELARRMEASIVETWSTGTRPMSDQAWPITAADRDDIRALDTTGNTEVDKVLRLLLADRDPCSIARGVNFFDVIDEVVFEVKGLVPGAGAEGGGD